MYVFVEYGILGTHPIYPATGNQYDYKSNFIYTLPSTVIMGIIQGSIEVLWLKKALQKEAVWKKIILKTFFYVLLIVVFLIALTAITGAISANYGNLNRTVSQEVISFFYSFAFWSIVFYIGIAVLLTLFITEVKDYVGDALFKNFLFGKYNSPLTEERIFMFLDMKSSTTIAEEIGHENYFELIRDYYADMTTAILDSDGEIYQYVGDEIVVTWPKDKGLLNNNCVACFHRIQEAISKRKSYYLDTYALLPEFKAGLHIGEVTTGEIGVLKKEIIFTGDVLNTTARIQSKCNMYSVKILISKQLKQQLNTIDTYKFKRVDTIQLRGKQREVQLFTLV